ncbi:hypothetical protein [Duganella sp. LjRoot269]|jgi:hypothetical protein|uniref:hypothetical protein n=1 Tax=Duganella sp. LjRoot269 TaxID=3342305 RepID=UPI003ED1255F
MSERYILNKTFPFLCLSCLLGCSEADSTAVVGLWENQPVVTAQMKVLARPNYVFTNRPLTEATVFTGLQNDSAELIVVCCIKVSKPTAVDVKVVLQKYASDTRFVQYMKNIKGLPYVYEAEPVDGKRWTSMMKTVMETAEDKNVPAPYSVPVIAATFDKKETLPLAFQINGQKARLTSKEMPNGDAVRYQFTLNGKVITFSEPSDPHD